MLQQIIALIIIFFFIFKLVRQKKDEDINNKEFFLWLIFWLLATVAIVFIRQLDRFVAWLGFSGDGINFLIYLAVLALFYLVFRLQLSLAKLDRNLTDIVRKIALDDKK